MAARSSARKAASVAALGLAPLALTALAASPAAAHGSMTDPVSRVSACFQEGPESPKSAACKAAVQASGAQAFYDWNGVNIANAAGKHKEIIPDGELCSAGNEKYKGLDLPRADWPSTKLSAGNHTFRYAGTAPHKGSFQLYITKDSYDPSKPLKWSDLEEKPFVDVKDPKMEGGDYVFEGKIPAREGRHLIYSTWQRSDSPEAFYTCSDVVFGGDNAGASDASDASAAAPEASAPSQEQIDSGADKSTLEHHGHGDQDAETGAHAPADAAPEGDTANAPEVNGGAEKASATGENLAETGGDSTTPYIAIGGAAALAVGAAALFGSTRRRAAATGGRHGR